MINLSLSLHSNPRRNGFWKLNTSLLKETSYQEEIKVTIRQTVNEYEDDHSVNAVLPQAAQAKVESCAYIRLFFPRYA